MCCFACTDIDMTLRKSEITLANRPVKLVLSVWLTGMFEYIQQTQVYQAESLSNTLPNQIWLNSFIAAFSCSFTPTPILTFQNENGLYGNFHNNFFKFRILMSLHTVYTQGLGELQKVAAASYIKLRFKSGKERKQVELSKP